MSLIDKKYIECYTILTLANGITDKTIEQAMMNVGVPEKYRAQVELRVAERTIETLYKSSKE